METKGFPRVLVLGNQCMAKASANGRTLGNLFIGWPKDRLAQFYIGGNPDDCFCTNYYQVSDRDALRAFLLRPIGNGQRTPGESVSTAPELGGKMARSSATMLARELVWSSGRWKRFGFRAWLQTFHPEVVVLQAGDSVFMLRLAMEISGHYRIPLLVYNSECYCFKDFDYFQEQGLPRLLYPLFYRLLLQGYRALLRQAAISVYNCEALQKLYDETFHRPSVTLYTGTEVVSADCSEAPQEGFTVSYMGNMDVGRMEALLSFAEVLESVSASARLHLYGKLPYNAAARRAEQRQNIVYHGFVPYEEVQNAIRHSDLLLHTESFSAFYRRDLQYAFSTKIADSLGSGKPFLIFAPDSFACVQYLKEHDAAFCASDPEDLRRILYRILHTPGVRDSHIQSALKLAKSNHSVIANSGIFQKIIAEIL